jgi:hypothetical protein
MSEPMAVRLEIWPVSADTTGIWLVSGDDAWRPRLPVMADTEPHADVDLELYSHGAADDVALLHSTSWRVDGPAVVLTYMAVLRNPGVVLDRWPNARPISLPLVEAVGKPPTHSPIEPPAPRHIDVLLHGLRHFRLLMAMDATSAAALIEPWPTHLQPLQPALAGLYSQVHAE